MAAADERPPPRRSYFKNRPAWAVSPSSKISDSSDEEGSGTNMFSRSTDTLARLKESNALRRERERQKQEAQQLKAKEKLDKKRRKILQRAAAFGLAPPADATGDLAEPLPAHDPDAGGSGGKDSGLIITVESDGEKPGKATRASPRQKMRRAAEKRKLQGAESDSDSDSDADLAAIAARARAGRLRWEQEARAKRAAEAQKREAAPAEKQAPDPKDPAVAIFVHSDMPDTEPLIVQRKISQPLGVVKEAWCRRQGMDDRTTESTVLTWRNARLYSTTTCKSLGVDVDEFGDLYIRGDRQAAGPENGQLAMEVMTLEEHKLRQAENERKIRARIDGTDFVPTRSPAAAAAAAADSPSKGPAEVKLRIALKARGFKDYGLRVKPTTKCAQILLVWKDQMDLAPATDAYLVFDGERLDVESTVADAEVGDGDSLEVHVKS